MFRNWSKIRGIALAFLVAVSLLAAARTSVADTLHLKDGRVLEGTVAREVDGYVWFKFKIGSLETEQMFGPSEIAKLERDTPSPAEKTAAAPAAAERRAPDVNRKVGVPRAAIISLGEGGGKDMVGMYMTAEQLRRSIPDLQAEKIDTVVFVINSGGGYTYEVQQLSDVIHNEFKPKFRVVAWIESAISAAAMTSHCIEEIYFMSRGSYGACTEFSGPLVASKDRDLEDVLFKMEKISARGGYNPYIMKAMQVMQPLSCSIDENGDVSWYDNLNGEHIVNPENRVLTLTARDAVKYKFAKGIADTYQELGKAMGFNEVEWVGKVVPGVPYPVCRAEENMRKFRNQVAEDEARLREYLVQYNLSIQIAQGSPAEDRGKFVARARQQLNNIRNMVRNNPNFAFYVFGMWPEDFRDWVEEQEEILRRLMRR